MDEQDASVLDNIVTRRDLEFYTNGPKRASLSLEQVKAALEERYDSEVVDGAIAEFQHYKGLKKELKKLDKKIADIRPSSALADSVAGFFDLFWGNKFWIAGVVGASLFGWEVYQDYCSFHEVWDTLGARANDLLHCLRGYDDHSNTQELKDLYLQCAAQNAELVKQGLTAPIDAVLPDNPTYADFSHYHGTLYNTWREADRATDNDIALKSIAGVGGSLVGGLCLWFFIDKERYEERRNTRDNHRYNRRQIREYQRQRRDLLAKIAEYET